MSNSPITLVVDPGTSTGVAVFRHRVLVTSFTCDPPYTLLWTSIRRYAAEPGTTVELVVEGAPQGHRHQPGTVELQKQLELADCHVVRPSEWKGHPASRLLQGDHPATKHERDAIGLGRYWLNTKHARHTAQAPQS